METKGIYRRIRHPQAYQALLWPALAFGLHSPLLLAISIPLVLIQIMATNSEETDLMIRHGEPYLKYRDKMGMFFPKGNTTSEFIKKAITPFKGFLNSDKEEDQ